jgi:hypothetical protein
MKTRKHKIISAIAILAIALAPIFCCSLMKNAFADLTSLQSVEKTNPMPCHKSSNQDTTSSNNNCDCNKVSAFIQAQNSDILKSFFSVSSLASSVFTGNLFTLTSSKNLSQSALFDSSPPHLEGTVHLYLQNSILRI